MSVCVCVCSVVVDFLGLSDGFRLNMAQIMLDGNLQGLTLRELWDERGKIRGGRFQADDTEA